MTARVLKYCVRSRLQPRHSILNDLLHCSQPLNRSHRTGCLVANCCNIPHQVAKLQAHKRINPFLESRQSSVETWSVVIVGSICGIALLSILSNDIEPLSQSERKPTQLISSYKEVHDWSKMTGEVEPGRPGTLTSEQEDKLRELWAATYNVFGVMDPDDSATGAQDRSNTTSSKKTKKRKGFFRSKQHEDDSSPQKSKGSAPNTAVDAEDKYGQKKDFQEAISSLSPETLRATFWSMVKHDHPDGLLLRFLRARKWDIEKALIMMVSTMRWRAADMHVDDDIMATGELKFINDEKGDDPEKKKFAEDFLAQLRLGKTLLHGSDKAGRPMCIVRVRLHRKGEQSEESLERFTVYTIESSRMALAPPVDTACLIFDMTGFSMANMDYAPVKFMIKCFEANYPESLGVVLVHRAPWVFQGVWRIIRGWLDPVVASKVHFTNSKEDMEEFVDSSQITKELGGDCDWAFEYTEPVQDENERLKDIETRDKILATRDNLIKDYQDITLEWVRAADDVDITAIKTRRHEIAMAIRDNYWQLDPYIRARSFFDRNGLIAPHEKEATNGTVDMETVPGDLD